MPFDIQITDVAVAHLKGLRVFERRQVYEAIFEQLVNQPTAPTRNRKCLRPDVAPAFPHEPPVWELRVGEHRVFYDVDQDAEIVFVRAILHKSQGQTTGDIIT